jgi:hypothetical protein
MPLTLRKEDMTTSSRGEKPAGKQQHILGESNFSQGQDGGVCEGQVSQISVAMATSEKHM